jgi:hypothetical protein
VKASTLWAVIIAIAVLSTASRCGDGDPPKESVRGPTAPATATVTATPAPIVRVRSTVPAPCRLAAADSRKVEAALFEYEKWTGAISEVQDITAAAIGSADIHRLNEAREKFMAYQSNSTAALQALLAAQSHLKIHNAFCRDSLRK